MNRRKYYYIKAIEPRTGKPYLIYGGVTEDSARQKGLEQLSGLDFEIVAFPTSNLQTASSMLRGERLKETHSLFKASQRIGHGKSLKRLRHRLSDM